MNISTDRRLIALAFQGNPEAFAELVRRYQSAVFNTACRILALLVCVSCAPAVPESITNEQWEPFTDGDFSVELPADWKPASSDDDQVIYGISDGTGSLWVKTWPLVPSLVASSVREWAASEDSATLVAESGSPENLHLDLTLAEGLILLRLSTQLIYCEARAYEVTGVAPDADFSRYVHIFEQAHASAACQVSTRYPHLETGALGMVIVPPAVAGSEFDLSAYQESLALARSSGVQVSHIYLHWDDFETGPGTYDWAVPDVIIEAHALEGLQLSVVFSIIHTTVRGRIPEDLARLTFDDPDFIRRLGDFLAAFTERYAGQLHYLAIGNEVNDYFGTHRDQIQAYAAAFDAARDAVHTVDPDLPVGIVFAYHDAETQNTMDIIQQLNRGDYLAYTLYLYEPGFRFQRNPAEIGPYLDRMIALAGDTPVVITETGWNTAPELDGSEGGQAEYIRQFFAALPERREKIRFVSWFDLHDSQRSTCERDALTFFEPGTEPGPEFMEPFVTFICNFGLRTSDGTPKLGWETWVQQAEAYYR